MGRQRQPGIRERLLDECTDYALAHGLPDRLAPLARATATSSRMLLYHFGTRDDLLREILREARARQRRDFGEVLRAVPGEPYTQTLARAWSTMTGPEGRPYVLMFTALRENDERSLWPGFSRAATADWLEPLESGLETIGRSGSATLVLAVIRGLLMDLQAMDDAARVDRAFLEFVDALNAVPRDATSGRA